MAQCASSRGIALTERVISTLYRSRPRDRGDSAYGGPAAVNCGRPGTTRSAGTPSTAARHH